MARWDIDLLQDNKTGLAGSVLLHGLIVLAWLFWSQAHPRPPAPALKTMMVELVAVAPIVPGPSGGAPATIRRAPVPAAPHVAATSPTGVKPLPDAVEQRIKSLAELRSPDSALPAPDNGAGRGGSNGTGDGYALADFVRAQILRRWWPDLGTGAARGTPVAIRLTLSRSGTISNVRILDRERFENDKLFHGMAISARNAALLASPISLPPGNYQPSMEIALTLDPRAALH